MQLTIDERIRTYIFIPLLFLMFMLGIVKMYLQKYMNGGPKPTIKTPNQKALTEKKYKSMIARSSLLRLSGGLLTSEAFAMRQKTLTGNSSCSLRVVEAQAEGDDPMEKMMSNPMMNPSMMGGMLKNNLTSTVTQMLQYGLINHFFSGFVVGKVPFPLTQSFRGMLQSGVSVLGLDVKYVSSLSLYFLSIFSFGSIYAMIFTEDDDDFSNPLAQMNPMGAMGGMGGAGMKPNDKLDEVCKKEAGKKHV